MTAGNVDAIRIVIANWRDEADPSAGGAEVYASELAKGLVEAGAEVTYLTSRPKGQAAEEVVDGVLHYRAGKRWSSYLIVPWWLLRHRDQVDAVIDCQNGLAYCAPLFVRRATTCVLLVHHVHREQWGVHFPRPVAAFGRWLEHWTAARVYRDRPVVAVSESTATAVRRTLGHRGPVVVAHNGAPPVDSVARHAVRSAVPRISCVSRLAPHKRVELLIAAAAELRDRHPGLQVDVVGTGAALTRLRDMVDAAGVADTVRLHGWLSEHQRRLVVARSWVHAQPSMGEGWGLTVIEAAAAGVPSVVFPVPGLADSVLNDRTGWHVAPGETFADCLDRALGEVEDVGRAEQIGSACRDWAESFRWQDTVIVVLGLLAGAAPSSGNIRLPAQSPELATKAHECQTPDAGAQQSDERDR